MSDLISRSDTMKRLRDYAEQKHYNGEVELANGILKAVCFIEHEENIPTAYDVNAVDEQLDEYSFAPYDDYPGFVVDIEQASELIRKGGVNENNN